MGKGGQEGREGEGGRDSLVILPGSAGRPRRPDRGRLNVGRVLRTTSLEELQKCAESAIKMAPAVSLSLSLSRGSTGHVDYDLARMSEDVLDRLFKLANPLELRRQRIPSELELELNPLHSTVEAGSRRRSFEGLPTTGRLQRWARTSIRAITAISASRRSNSSRWSQPAVSPPVGAPQKAGREPRRSRIGLGALSTPSLSTSGGWGNHPLGRAFSPELADTESPGAQRPSAANAIVELWKGAAIEKGFIGALKSAKVEVRLMLYWIDDVGAIHTVAAMAS